MMTNDSKAERATKPPSLAGLAADMDGFRKDFKDLVESMKIEFAKHYGEIQNQISDLAKQVPGGFQDGGQADGVT